MAINLDAFVQGIIDSKSPERRENRRIVKVSLAEDIVQTSDQIMLKQLPFAAKVKEAVAKGEITQAQGDRMIANRERMADALSNFSSNWLEDE